MPDLLRIGDREFGSRLLLGTGKFPSGLSMRAAIESSRTEVVTVALRRVDVAANAEDILDFVDTDRVLLLPNTSGAQSADEAVFSQERDGQQGPEAGGHVADFRVGTQLVVGLPER